MRGKLRLLAALAACAVLMWAMCAGFPQPALAASPSFSFQTGGKAAEAGGTVSLAVRVGAGSGVAGFRLRVSYDPTVLRFAGVSPSPQIAAGTLQTNTASNPVCSVYVCNVDLGYAPPLSGTVVTYDFRVLADAPAGPTDMCACVDETCDYAAQDLALDACETITLSVSAAPSAEARLTALRPSAGELFPEFSPDRFSYCLPVGSEVASVVFEADASEGAAVTVGRKSLSAPGTDTPITITVTAENRKTKAVYLVTVNRAEKAGKPESSAGSGGKGSSPLPSSAAKAAPNGKSKSASAVKPPSTGKKSVSSSRRVSKALAESALAAAKQGKHASSSAAVRTAGGGASSGWGTASTAVPAAVSTVPLTVVQDRMPTYLIGMLAAGFCMVTGVLLSLWLGGKKK